MQLKKHHRFCHSFLQIKNCATCWRQARSPFSAASWIAWPWRRRFCRKWQTGKPKGGPVVVYVIYIYIYIRQFFWRKKTLQTSSNIRIWYCVTFKVNMGLCTWKFRWVNYHFPGLGTDAPPPWHICINLLYSPQHGTWKSPLWKGDSSSKPSFFGFHVSFQGCVVCNVTMLLVRLLSFCGRYGNSRINTVNCSIHPAKNDQLFIHKYPHKSWAVLHIPLYFPKNSQR